MAAKYGCITSDNFKSTYKGPIEIKIWVFEYSTKPTLHAFSVIKLQLAIFANCTDARIIETHRSVSMPMKLKILIMLFYLCLHGMSTVIIICMFIQNVNSKHHIRFKVTRSVCWHKAYLHISSSTKQRHKCWNTACIADSALVFIVLSPIWQVA